MDLVKLLNGLKKSPQTRLTAFMMTEKLAELVKLGYTPDGSDAEKIALLVIAVGEQQGMDYDNLEQPEKEEKPAMGFCDFKKAA